jgi:hypothetical protein
VSGDRLTTRTDGVHLAPETQAAATRYLIRSGNADILPILGLAYEQPRGRVPCPSCGMPLPDPVTNGGRKPCQRRKCKAGPVARGVKR